MKTKINGARLAEAVRRTLEDLKTLRDETRLQVNLAGREARDKWRALEDKLARSAEDARAFGESTATALDDLKEELRCFGASLRRDKGRTARSNQSDHPS